MVECKKTKGGKALKNIFSKYIVTFVLVLGIGFITIAAVLSSVISEYSSESKKTLMENTAETVYGVICSIDGKSGGSFDKIFEEKAELISETASPLAEYSESVIIVTDSEGNMLIKAGEDKNQIQKSSADITAIKALTDSDADFIYGNLGGLFPSMRLNYVYTVKGENEDFSEGLIILSSAKTGLSNIRSQIFTILIIACIWTFIAAVVAVYFITNRVVSPLKAMRKAAKSYSSGDFSPRVTVKGNDEIADLATAFNQMAQSLDSFEKTRNSFLSSVSHDLRTPMTSIQGFIDGILDGTIPPEKHSYYLALVSVEVRRLSRLVSSLLEISRLESGKVKFNKTSFDVCEVARLILISFEEKINEKKLEIEFDADNDSALVFADRDAIHQVLYNLCDNAIKFTNDGGLIKISVKDIGKKYEISVYNTGIGINEEDLPHVFEHFYKSDASRGLDKTGTGLGLYIVKSKIEAHGEKISVESEYGNYCCFKFTLTKEQ